MQAYRKVRPGPGGELARVADPRPGPGEVLVAVRASSICGTDLHLWEWNEWARSRVHNLPMTLGHELSGEIIELGPEVRSLSVGDHVSAETHLADGTCFQCRTGKMHICANVQVLGVDRDGVFAERVVLPEANAWKNDPRLDHTLASIQEPLGNAVHALIPEESSPDLGGATVLVTGCGPIGLLAVTVSKMLGAEKVLATEVNPARAALARKMGADLVLDPRSEGERIAERIRLETGGHGVDVALEMSGHPGGLQLVFDALTPGGRVSLLGLLDGPATLDVDTALVLKAARVYGIFGRRMFATWYTVRGLLERADLREKMAAIITHRVPLGELPRAMELARAPGAAKVSLEAKW